MMNFFKIGKYAKNMYYVIGVISGTIGCIGGAIDLKNKIQKEHKKENLKKNEVTAQA